MNIRGIDNKALTEAINLFTKQGGQFSVVFQDGNSYVGPKVFVDFCAKHTSFKHLQFFQTNDE